MDPLAFTGVFAPACLGIVYGLVIGRLLLYVVSAAEKINQAWTSRRTQPVSPRRLEAAAKAGRKTGRELGRLARV